MGPVKPEPEVNTVGLCSGLSQKVGRLPQLQVGSMHAGDPQRVNVHLGGHRVVRDGQVDGLRTGRQPPHGHVGVLKGGVMRELGHNVHLLPEGPGRPLLVPHNQREERSLWHGAAYASNDNLYFTHRDSLVPSEISKNESKDNFKKAITLTVMLKVINGNGPKKELDIHLT